MTTDQHAVDGTRRPGVAAFNPAALSDAKLLGQLLYRDQSEKQGERHAGQLLRKFGGLRGLVIASRQAADARNGLAEQDAVQIRLAHELVRRQLRQSLQRGAALTSPAMTVEYLQTLLRDRQREIFTCLFLDTRHRVIAAEDLFQGSIDGACI